MKKVLLVLTILVMCLAGNSVAQELRVHEKYGIKIDFPEGWLLVGENAYSSLMQTQLFLDSDSLDWVFLERYLHLSQIDKDNWNEGLPYGNLFDQAEEIEKLDKQDWPIKMPDFSSLLLQSPGDGAAIYRIRSMNTAAHVVFLARGDSFVRITVGTSRPGLDLKAMADILQSIKISPSQPPLKADPYTIAERAYLIEKNYKKALDLYKLVPSEHPKYAHAKEMLTKLEQEIR